MLLLRWPYALKPLIIHAQTELERRKSSVHADYSMPVVPTYH